ncbi:hypothetical protein P692DRAFT_20544338 [Suillus brevipes Sb2]|nr:hypothetical protein P692DRAFT_20544338 [Suillus brevipes Sb2]
MLSLTRIVLHRSIHLVRLSISIATHVLFIMQMPSFNEHSNSTMNVPFGLQFSTEQQHQGASYIVLVSTLPY